MIFSAILIALALAILTLVILRNIFKPVTSSKKKFMDESKKAGRTMNQFNWKETRDKLMSKIKTVNLSEEMREELSKDLIRLGWDTTPEDIRRLQILYTIGFIILSVLMLFISLLLGMLMIAFTPLVWNIPVSYVKSAIRARNEEFLDSLDGLYTVIFNQYKRSNREHFGKILMAYLPTSSDLMRKDLMLILRDVDLGEEYALKQLKYRIPNPVVMRFCDIILNNLEGVDNVDVMENFYMELKDVRDRRRRKRNEERAKKLDLVNKLLYVPFGFLVIVYLIVSTLSNFY